MCLFCSHIVFDPTQKDSRGGSPSDCKLDSGKNVKLCKVGKNMQNTKFNTQLFTLHTHSSCIMLLLQYYDSTYYMQNGTLKSCRMPYFQF